MRGVIAAGSRLTAQAGAEMLKAGGNAVDAAIAAAFVSFIAEIAFVHLGGSGIAQVHDPSTGKTLVYDFFSDAPGLGGRRQPDELDFREVTIDFGSARQSFHLGRGAVAVPGNIVGLCAMADDFATLPLPSLLHPAISLAREGFQLDAFQAETCRILAPLFTNTPEMRAIFAPKGRLIQAGDRLFIPHLAETLIELSVEGVASLRNGRLGKAILCDQKANGGGLTEGDLQLYAVRRIAPVRVRYRDFEALLPPPSSTGGALTAFSLKVLSNFNVRRLKHGAASHLRLLAETMAATSRARRHWDQWIEDLPVQKALDHFLDEDFVAKYAAEVEDSLRTRKPSRATEAQGPSATSHLSVIDRGGLAVSLTTTAGESAGYVVPWTGFIPNNIMGEEDLHPHGFFSRPSGQRIHTMMTPLLVSADDGPQLVIGSGGSTRIRSATLQVLSNLIDFKMGLGAAVNHARVHYENGVLQCEAGTDPGAVDRLERDGYRVNRWDRTSIYFGGAHAVMRSPLGRLAGAGDPRRGGAVEFT